MKNVLPFILNATNNIDSIHTDKKLLWKSLKKNKKMLKSMEVAKKEFSESVMDSVMIALEHKYAAVTE